LIFSQIKTERGGNIELVVPGGGVNAGLATPPEGFDKGPSNLGIVSVKGGDIRALARRDFEVNQSRVFTLGGGSILIWSSLGNIDAGRGARTAISAPPPIIRINENGQLVVEFPGAATGSGIGTLITTPGALAGDVDLIAPTGTVSAGDATIRSEAGRVTIAAQKVVGADSISGAQGVVGVPPAAPSSGSSLSGLSGATAQATKSAEQATQALTAASVASEGFVPSFITVEVIGLGDEEDEEERRKRQQR